MVKGNHAISQEHFHKHWARYRVNTWLDQPARAKRRHLTRAKKAAALFPAPLNKLRPVVGCCTVRYNHKVRLGKGFTAEELKAAGFKVREAKQLGISIDNRRRATSEEKFQNNVDRLKEYKGKLVIRPLNPQKVKKSEVSLDQWKEALSTAVQPLGELMFSAAKPAYVPEARALTSADQRSVVSRYIGEKIKVVKARRVARWNAKNKPQQ